MAGVKLLSFWGSPFALRVRWTLKLKGVEYEYIEEDLTNNNKSAMFLQYNPVYKKVPVLVHGEKAIAESLVIIEYIDEEWRHNPLLPEDPYERALARFWAKFAEEKCLPPMFAAFSSTGEDQARAIKVEENLKTLQGALNGRMFFGGETVGLVDIVAGWFAYWLPINEEILGMKFVDRNSLPALEAWFAAILELEIVKDILPPKDKLLVF